MLIIILFAMLGMMIEPGITYWVVFGLLCVVKLFEGFINAYKLGRDDG